MKFPRPTLNAILRWRLEEASDAVAYHEEHRPGDFRAVPYSQSRRVTLEAAAGLEGLGCQRGDRVGVLLPVCPEWTLVDFANLLMGYVTVGVYPTCTPEQVAYMLGHSSCRVLVLQDEGELDRLAAALSELPDLEVVVTLDAVEPRPDAPWRLLRWDHLLAEGSSRLDGTGEEAILAQADAAEPDDLVTIVYTSGTTGPPKGAMLTHRNLFSVCDSVRQVMGLREDDRSVVYLPLAHILQRYTVYLGLTTGIHGYFLSDIPRLGDVLTVVKPTVLAVVPRVLEKIHGRAIAASLALPPRAQEVFAWAFDVGRERAAALRAGQRVGLWLALRHRVADRLVLSKVRSKLGGAVRMVVSGGAPLAPELSEWFHAAGLLVFEGYGLTETSAPATTNLPTQYRFGTVGKALPGTEVRIADDGEIEVRGDGVFRGYYLDEAATAAVFTADGFFRTGDIGELDADGFLRITDRKKDLLITAGGKNVSPANIENLLKQHPLVGQAMVCGDREPYLVALIALDAEEAPGWAAQRGLGDGSLGSLAGDPSVRELLQRHVDDVNSRLAPFETIKKFDVVDVPFEVDNGFLTPTLKLRRKPILQAYGDRVTALYGP